MTKIELEKETIKVRALDAYKQAIKADILNDRYLYAYFSGCAIVWDIVYSFIEGVDENELREPKQRIKNELKSRSDG